MLTQGVKHFEAKQTAPQRNTVGDPLRGDCVAIALV